MNLDPQKLTADVYPEIKRLGDSCNNIDNITYSEERGALTIDQLPTEVAQSDAFKEYVAVMGWPTHSDDIIRQSRRYATDKDFIESLRVVDEYVVEAGPKHIGVSMFPILLQQKPKMFGEGRVQGDSIFWMMGELPVVSRAHLLAPELFDDLRSVLKSLAEQYVTPISGDDELYEHLMQPKQAGIIRAIHMAYKIMARLLTVHDMQLAGLPGDIIVDADRVLRNGGNT